MIKMHYIKGIDVDNLGKYDEAITYYDKALGIDPNDKSALNGKDLALKLNNNNGQCLIL